MFSLTVGCKILELKIWTQDVQMFLRMSIGLQLFYVLIIVFAYCVMFIWMLILIWCIMLFALKYYEFCYVHVCHCMSVLGGVICHISLSSNSCKTLQIPFFQLCPFKFRICIRMLYQFNQSNFFMTWHWLCHTTTTFHKACLAHVQVCPT